MFKKLIEKIKNKLKKYIDYRITGEYYTLDDKGRYVKKYHKKYYIKIK